MAITTLYSNTASSPLGLIYLSHKAFLIFSIRFVTTSFRSQMETHPCNQNLRLLRRAVYQLKLLPGVDTTSHFLRPITGKKPNFNDPRVNKNKLLPRTDRNLKIGLGVDKNLDKWDKKASKPPSPSLRGTLLPPDDTINKCKFRFSWDKSYVIFFLELPYKSKETIVNALN